MTTKPKPAAKPLVISSFPKSLRENLRVCLINYRGAHQLDVRATTALAAHTDTQVPTGKGLSLDVALIPRLRVALAKAERQARKMGWLE